MGTSELKGKNIEELKELVKSKIEESEKHAQNIIKGKDKNTSKIKLLRRELARIKTVIREKEINEKSEEKNG